MSDCAVQTLPGFGPDVRDTFRFSWWNTPEGARVWIEHCGAWREGVIVARKALHELAVAVDLRHRSALNNTGVGSFLRSRPKCSSTERQTGSWGGDGWR